MLDGICPWHSLINYSTLFDENPMMLFIIDQEGTVRSINRHGAAHLGYTPEELIGKPVLNIFFEEDRPSVAQQIDEAFKNPEKVMYWEFRKVRKDGSLIWVKEFARPLKESTGAPSILISCEDITERKHAEEELKKGKELSDALNLINTEIHSTLDFDIIMERTVSEAAKAIEADASLIGLFEDDLFIVKYVYRISTELLQEHPKQELKGTMYAASRRDVVVFNDAHNDERLNLDIVRKQGVRAMMIAPLLVKGTAIGALVFYCFASPFAFADIHVDFARKLSASLSLALANARLFAKMKTAQERASFFANAVETSSQPFASIYPDGRYRIFNRAYAVLTGYDPEELRSMSVHDITALGWHEYEKEQFEELRRTGEPRLYEKEYRRKNGNLVPVEVKVHRITDQTGSVRYYYAFVTDITERKKAETALKGVNEKLKSHATNLEQAYKDIESFSYAASQDLKAPLVRIIGFSKIILESYADKVDEYGKDVLNRLADNTQKMKEIVGDLLEFSTITRKEIRESEINMEALARSVFKELKPAGDREFQVEIKKMPPADGDPFMIRHVFADLLSNAIKFTRTRGLSIIETGGYIEGDENIYYVRDNGIGFDMQFVDKLFGLFQRVHTEKQFEGTGHGLVIVKKIIEKHGGRVWAEGNPNQGAAFYFSLPRKAD